MAYTININPVIIERNKNIRNCIKELVQYTNYKNYVCEDLDKITFADFFNDFCDFLENAFCVTEISNDKIKFVSDDANWNCDTVEHILEILSKYTDNHYVEFRDEEGELHRMYYLRDGTFKTIEPTLCWSMPGIYHNKED